MGTENTGRSGLSQERQRKLAIKHEHEMKMIKLRKVHEVARIKREHEFALMELEHKHELEMLKMRGGWLGRIFGCS